MVGIDALLPYYPVEIKRSNLQTALLSPKFQFHPLDLRKDNLSEVLSGCEVVFHLAALPGLSDFSQNFDLYMGCNIEATYRLLEALRKHSGLHRLVYASTSSVYGKFASGNEHQPTAPISPYGVTKLAAEQLCRAYGEEFGMPIVTLRYFSVYGPRQRPDMGYHRFIHALLNNKSIRIFGDGHQKRGNTFISDCVAATIAAVKAAPGETFNVGGGETASVWDILSRLARITGCPLKVQKEKPRTGDQQYTTANTQKIQKQLGWAPKVPLEEGLSLQVAWHVEQAQAQNDLRAPSEKPLLPRSNA